jgi:predicted regulator of Ras-like GTPase activity (Roadblock/LC7/MglB family)
MFRDTIQKTIDRLEGTGGAAGVLMGFDGIAVDSYVRPGLADVQTIAAELTHIVAEIRRSVSGAGVGALTEMTVRTDKLAVLIQLVTKDYFLVLGVPPDGNVGKARYLLRLLAPQIRAEL